MSVYDRINEKNEIELNMEESATVMNYVRSAIVAGADLFCYLCFLFLFKI